MEKKQEKIIEVEEKIEEEREEFEDEKELQRDILETQNIPKKMEKEENIGKIALGITPGIVYDNPSSGSMGRIIKKYETTTFAKKERNQNSLLGRPISYRECPKKTNKYFYKQPKKCIDMNIVFLKGPKVAGSVIGGIARQIALRQNINCPHCFLDTAIKIGEPKVVANHIGSKEKMIHLDMNTRKDTFKFTMFREPLKRCLSNYEHHKVRDGFGHKEATVNRFIHYARKECNDRLFKYYALAFKPMAESLDFIGVTERTDESVLAIAHMLKLGMGDVLYHATKVANSGKGYNGHNVDLNDKKIKNFTKYDFSRNNVNDLAYWQKANTNLDDIIHKVGRSRFNLQLKNFKEHVQRANAVCKANICLWSDNGCAFPCFTEYSNAHNLYAPISDKDWKPVDIDLSFTPTVKNWVPSEHHGRENLTYVPSK